MCVNRGKNISRFHIMASIIDILYEKYIQPNQKFVITLLMLIVFIIAGYYAYKWFARPVIENQTTQDMANYNGRKSEVKVLIFTADWCPHCVRAKPEWLKFESAYDGKEIGNYIVKPQMVDCTNGDTPLIQQYGIDGYPTLIMIKDGDQRVNYDAKITESNLVNFVNSILA